MIVNVTKLPVNDFVWVEETFQFNGDFKKLYNENSNIRHFIEADILYPEKFMNFIMIFPFCLKV